MPYIYRPEKIERIIKDTNLSEEQLFMMLSKEIPASGMMVLIVTYALDGSISETKAVLEDMEISPSDIDILITRERGTEEDFNRAVDIFDAVPLILPSHVARLIRASGKDAFEMSAWMNEMEPYLIELDSEAKVRSYFSDISKEKDFKNAITTIRKEYLVPEEGFPDVDTWWDYENSDPERKSAMIEQSGIIAAKYELGPEWVESIYDYIVLGSQPMDSWPQGSLVNVEDEKILKYGDEAIKPDDTLNSSRPISIRISPYATKRDILEYVEKMYTFTIFEAQSKYRNPKSKLLRVRSRNEAIQERNDLVYKYKNLPYKEILKKLPKEMRGALDEGSIGKIISLENKKRA